jgi:hypothetical protein
MRAAVDELAIVRDRIADMGDDTAIESIDEAIRLIMGDEEGEE